MISKSIVKIHTITLATSQRSLSCKVFQSSQSIHLLFPHTQELWSPIATWIIVVKNDILNYKISCDQWTDLFWFLKSMYRQIMEKGLIEIETPLCSITNSLPAIPGSFNPCANHITFWVFVFLFPLVWQYSPSQLKTSIF